MAFVNLTLSLSMIVSRLVDLAFRDQSLGIVGLVSNFGISQFGSASTTLDFILLLNVFDETFLIFISLH